MSRLCLDTSAYSHFKRGHQAAIERLRRARWVGVPAVVLGELRYGFLAGSRAEANEAQLGTFLANPVVEVLPVDDATSQVYSEIQLALRRAGKPLPTNDVWIAASAALRGATVLTFDPHFKLIERVGAIVLG